MAAAAAGQKQSKPLVLAEQGSFFVGGESKALPVPPASATPPGPGRFFAGGDITINQMYVQYQIPVNGARHVPVVMVHGCCLSSKTWETTPDGRMGWNEYFVRKDRPVYLADQVSRGRSGFDPPAFNAVKAGTAPRQRASECIGREPSGCVGDFSFRPHLWKGLSRRAVSDAGRRMSCTSK